MQANAVNQVQTKEFKFSNDNELNLLNSVLDKRREYFNIKRVLDIVISLILILLLSPIMLITAILIKLTSKGSILYKHSRVGYRNKLFTMLKFRSMKSSISSNDSLRINRIQVNGILCKLADDPRITKIGKFIRKTSIDELPQLFNVLMGDMSLVGPRPLVPFMVEPYPYISRLRSAVKPGITGMWQVYSRNKNTSVLDMIEWDLDYIEHCSIFLDLNLILNTIPTLISRRGAI